MPAAFLWFSAFWRLRALALKCCNRESSRHTLRLGFLGWGGQHSLKILQISSAQAFGGGERHLADLANSLAARGHEVHAVLHPELRLAAN